MLDCAQIRTDAERPSRAPDVLRRDCLRLDCAATTSEIGEAIRRTLARFRRRGLVVALSGGIDSSVTAALCVRALGASRVFGVHMPERDSATDTLAFSKCVSDHLGLNSIVEDITRILDSVGCYQRQEDSIRLVIPQYGPGWKSKVVIEGALQNGGFTYFNVVARSPDGQMIKRRLNSDAYLGIVAATNFKQRVRKMMEYYHADRLNYAVAGTPNRLEYDQGFFVKLGDGAADLKPIAHLYKSQVYQLADFLGIPEQIRQRPPTTDTYSLPQGQDEFYFSLPYESMDLCLFARNNDWPPEDLAPLVGLSVEHVRRVYHDIDAKRSATKYLHAPPQLVEEVLVHPSASP
jgi:NAD+ synthase